MRTRSANLSTVEERPQDSERFRIQVLVAAGLALGFAGAFLVVAVVVGVDAVINHGTIGSAARNTTGGRASPASGVWGLVVVLTLGAAWLSRSAIRAVRRGSYLGIVLPLSIFLVAGTVGEIVDLFGTASGGSDLVGAGILLLAAIPVVLLWVPLREAARTRAGPAGGDMNERSPLGGLVKVKLPPK